MLRIGGTWVLCAIVKSAVDFHWDSVTGAFWEVKLSETGWSARFQSITDATTANPSHRLITKMEICGSSLHLLHLSMHPLFDGSILYQLPIG